MLYHIIYAVSTFHIAQEELVGAHQQLNSLHFEQKRLEGLLKGVPLMLAEFMERNALPEPVRY